ncbi:YcjX family GTP-binding protein [Erwinia psidii]|uniref:YcjX family protein n=1 Tax=Erwinia psidii TaxID=69224 RepID=A0A3N6URS1_9GAMM|nr:YcjX family protein [Erwinia psidii]MCX8955992.1 YcjX family protein [Erwinia psidii]MCX8961364.1 YcjX family protein [Erwinia psidii]MCX8963790.1 YcjX family protein [Erwinia psidii]RQM38699.1 YcjX family protein [Erwinia psidii]
MRRLQNELLSLVNRSADRHLRLAVTGLSRSGKTAFITSLVNQLLNVNTGARLPMFSAVREQRLLGVKRMPQRDMGIPRFTYDQGIAQLYATPPAWPTPTHGVSEICLALRFRSQGSLLRHFRDTSTLWLDIVDYPGEWLLDLPMLAQDYFSWSRQMTGLLHGDRAHWSTEWQQLCEGLDPFAPADENRLAEIAAAWTDYLHKCKREGMHFIQPGRFVLPGEMVGAPALQFFPWLKPDEVGASRLAQATDTSNIGMLRARYNYYCQHVVKGFYKNYFLRFDRQIVLVDCLQPLNSGPQAFNDMQLALTQLMQSFSYGQRTLFRRLFSPVIDKLLFAATKSDHVTSDQHANLVSLLQQLVQDAWQHAAFEGINMKCIGLASVQATQSGVVDHQGDKLPALRGHRLEDNQPLTFYPGEVPPRLPADDFWQQQGFHFEQFRPQRPDIDRPLPHIRLDTALEFLLGDKLR